MKIFASLFLLAAAVSLVLSPLPTLAGGYQLPDYQKITLDNGLTILLMEQHEVPLIAMNVIIGGGAMVDGDHSGLAGMTAESLRLGAGDHSKQDLDQQFDFLGAKVGVSANREYSQLRASFAARDAEIMLPILGDLLRRPTFPAAEFAKYQQQHLARLTQQKESPRAVINNYFHRLLLGDHPYASAPEGDAESVARLTPEHLADYHQTWYQPQNTVLCVVGDFSLSGMQQQLTALFGDWKRGRTVVVDVGPLPTPDHARVLLVNKADAGESTFYIGGPGVAVTNPDRVGLRVVNTILGGRFTSWLNDELRVNAGLTYGARSGFVSYAAGGLFRISTFTRTATTFAAIDLALETYDRLWNRGIDEKTLASAKAYVKGQFPPRYETSDQLAGLLAHMQFYGYDESFINDFEAKVDGLTVADTKRLIDTYFPHENMQMVVVGEGDAIREELARYGAVSEVDIQQNGFAF